MKPLLKVEKLRVQDVRSNEVLVDNLSFELKDNRCLGIVGESGSGKSMTARAILGLLAPWLRTEGSAVFRGDDGERQLVNASEEILRAVRGRELCLILQDAMTAFDPLMPIGKQMAET
ncbi:MAG: ATP-binding cassette domain-containing protein, partial [Eubacterium sp.]